MARRVGTECTSSRTDARSAARRARPRVLYSPATTNASGAAKILEAVICAKLASGEFAERETGEGLGGEGHRPAV
jgi:hypothetical protein